MCYSFSEHSICFRCSKRWQFDYHTIHCPNNRCGVPKPQVIAPLVNTEPACLQCKIKSRARITQWRKQHKLQPLSWNMTNNSWDSVW